MWRVDESRKFLFTTGPAIRVNPTRSCYGSAGHSQKPYSGCGSSEDRLAEVLSNLLSPEGPNPVKSETKNHSIFFAQTDIESRILPSDCAAIPTVPDRHRRTDK